MATPQETLEQYPIKDRWTGEVLFTAEIATTPDMLPSVKLGLAVKWGLKERKNLSGANLSGVDLSRANLSRANLSRANLSRANLSGANLSGVDLYGVDLSGANLYGANLYGANLYGANLSVANLSGANLYGANLYGANLSGADLYGANLYGADLSGVDLSGVDLYGVENLKLPHFQLPEGDLIGWKALQDGVICKLRIPPDAKRTASVIGRKCRAEFVEVLEGEGFDKHTGKTFYKVGETVRPDKYDDNPLVECTHGIHFFATRAEAEEWV